MFTLQHVLNDRDEPLDVGLLIDVIALIMRDDGVNPRWLLTGEYDSSSHLAALQLVENRRHQPTASSELRRAVWRQLQEERRFATPNLWFQPAS